MVKRIAMSMVDGLIAALSAISPTETFEYGDLQWSAKASKNKWLKCEGQAISRNTYAGLFEAIGTAFGVGDGSATFNLPDGRGRALIGTGQGASLTDRALGASGGAETHQLTEAQIPAHTHTGTAASGGAHSHTVPSGGYSYGAGAGETMGDTRQGQQDTGTSGAHTHTLTINSTGGGAAHPNMQPFLAANLFIYAGV